MSHRKCGSSTEDRMPNRLRFDNDDINETNDDQNDVQVNPDVESGQQSLGCLEENKDSCDDRIDSQEQIYGEHEIQVSEGGEADLHRHFNNCEKDPEHTYFISTESFSKNHLPDGYCNDILYKYIKTVAKLTVRIGVGEISRRRPNYYPGTIKIYPLYEKRGTQCQTNGSGVVNRCPVKFNDGVDEMGKKNKYYTRCWCAVCKHSDTASRVWWEFNVITASHVVYDEIEARHTHLRFFYDKEDSKKWTVDKVHIDHDFDKHDWCVLNCVTCDKNLSMEIKRAFLKSDKYWLHVYRKYKNTRDKDKINFIVSHPHGCPKMISIGKWIEKLKIDDYIQITYTTSTCKGSSGAPVRCLGYRNHIGDIDFVHSGYEREYNFSGLGQLDEF